MNILALIPCKTLVRIRHLIGVFIYPLQTIMVILRGVPAPPDALCPAIARQVNLGHTAPFPSSIGLCR